MSGLRFESLELDYGCLHGRYRFPSEDEPIVVVGSNGSGKSTLIEGLVRTLFGFNRREPDARQKQEHRRPWRGGAFRAALVLDGAEGRLSISRDFDTHQVVVSRPATGEELLRGEANPAAPTSSDQMEYRELLRRVVGLVELSDYERTACVQQGQLVETALAQDLLRIAAGGHADVEAASQTILARYHELTLEPIKSGERRRRKPGTVERLEAQLEELNARIRSTRRAEDDRAPLLLESATLAAELDRLRQEVGRLEERHTALSRLRVLEEREETSLERIRRLEDAEKELREAIWKIEAACERPAVASTFPLDYLERLAALEELWARLERARAVRPAAEARPTRHLGARRQLAGGRLALGGTLLAAGAALVVLGGSAARALGAVVATAGAILVGLELRSLLAGPRPGEATAADAGRADSEIDEIERRIGSKLDGLPGGSELTPEALADRRREFAAWRAEGDRLEEMERRLRETTGGAVRALGSELQVQPTDLSRRRTESPEGRREASIAGAKKILAELEAGLSSERSSLAPTRVELERERSTVGELEVDAQTAFRQIDEELKARRRELTGKAEDERELQRRLVDLGRPEESSVALVGARRALESSLADARREAAAYARAWALLKDAYEQFRETDQERLLGHIDTHLSVLGSDRMGPLAVPDALDSASLMYGGRSLALASPPLSYGELHVVLFAVRLGAADFLAGLGVGLPLLVDDPFVHLDATRAARLWQLLRTIAGDRQVVVTTQDRLVLDHLGIRADHDLDGSERAVSAQMELPVDGMI